MRYIRILHGCLHFWILPRCHNRKTAREAETAQRTASELLLRNERIARRNVKLKAQQSQFHDALQEHVTKVDNHKKGGNSLMIRNYTSSTLTDPLTAVRALLLRQNIPCDNERMQIISHGPLCTHPGKSYIIAAFDDVSTKIELHSEARQLREHTDPELRELTIIDPLDTRALFKKANAQLRKRGGVASLKLEGSQILVPIRAGSEHIEIVSEPQLDDIAEQAAN